MSRGKYQTNNCRIPRVIWVLILIAALCLGTGTVFAYLRVTSDPLENQFSAAVDPTPGIADSYAVNVGEPGYAVYVRAAIVVTWQDTTGNVLGQAPVQGTDYTMELNSDWFEQNGFYYYSKPVSKSVGTDAVTSVLIDSCSETGTAPADGYTLHVEVVAQTIQALGTTDGDSPIPAVTAAWGVGVDPTTNQLVTTTS